MPWREVSAMSVRAEFVALAGCDGANRREMCRRFGISPTTGYKWLTRHQLAGSDGLVDRSSPRHYECHASALVERPKLQS